MTDIHAHPNDGPPFETAIEDAAVGMADSITRALHDERSTTLVCLILGALSAPVHFVLNVM